MEFCFNFGYGDPSPVTNFIPEALFPLMETPASNRGSKSNLIVASDVSHRVSLFLISKIVPAYWSAAKKRKKKKGSAFSLPTASGRSSFL